jgi:plasmid rolling circle replication initiator protein Rep
MEINLDKPYLITYSNYFEIDNKTFAFRKKCLFDITNIPKLLELKDNNNCLGYWINRKWFSLSKLKPLVKLENNVVDVSILQWCDQLHLDYVFNL